MNSSEREYLNEMKLSINDIFYYIHKKEYHILMKSMKEFAEDFSKHYDIDIPSYNKNVDLNLINNDNEMSNYLYGFADDLELNGCPVVLQTSFSKVLVAAKQTYMDGPCECRS